MKKIFAIAAICLATFACQKPVIEPTPEPEPEPDPIYLTSFGFKAEKNSCLVEDIIVDVKTDETAISIMLPYGVGNEELKSLIPSFELSDTAVVAKIGETIIESEVSAIDFSLPVDIVISKETINAQYSITVSTQAASSFTKIAESEFMPYSNPLMTINPKDGLPYFACSTIAATSAERKPYVLYFDGANVKLYNESPITEGQSDAFGLGFNSDGKAYVGFKDALAAVKNNTSVFSVDNNSATVLGEQGAIDQPTSAGAFIVPISDNEIYYLSVDNLAASKNPAVPKRCLNVAKFDGAAWSQAQAMGTRDLVNTPTYSIRAKEIRGEYYLVTIDEVSFSFYKYDRDAKAWIDYPGATNFVDKDGNKLANGAAINSPYTVDFDIATNGDIYVACCCDFLVADQLNYGVIKLSLESNIATVVGGGSFAPDYSYDMSKKTATHELSIALDANDVPYVVLGNSLLVDSEKNYSPAVLSYVDADTKSWTPLQPISENVETRGITIAFNEAGRGFISYKKSWTEVVEEASVSKSAIVVYSTEK